MLFTLFFENSFSQEEKKYQQKIVLEMELEQVVKLKIPKNLETPLTIEELNKIKQIQKYPSKNKKVNDCLPENKIGIPKNNTLIKEEEYENNQ